MPNPNFFTKIFDAVAELQRNGINLFESDSFSVRRVFGGTNNALYKIKSQTETLACKLFVLDGRNRALREFEALKAIRAAEYDIAPNPLLLDESLSIVQFPTVLYQWAEGYVLQPPIRQQHLETFLNSYHQLHSIQPSNHTDFQLDAWFHWFNFDAYLAEITEFFNLYTPWLETESSGGLKLRDRLQIILNECAHRIYSTEVNPNKERIPVCLVRVDPNTANAILAPNGIIRWVDWEYSGWGDPALDIAELRWHAALQPLGEKALNWLRANYKPPIDDPEFNERLHVWDHILAARWPLMILRALWSNHNGPDRERLSTVSFSSEKLYQNLEDSVKRAENLYADTK